LRITAEALHVPRHYLYIRLLTQHELTKFVNSNSHNTSQN